MCFACTCFPYEKADSKSDEYVADSHETDISFHKGAINCTILILANFTKQEPRINQQLTSKDYKLSLYLINFAAAHGSHLEWKGQPASFCWQVIRQASM